MKHQGASPHRSGRGAFFRKHDGERQPAETLLQLQRKRARSHCCAQELSACSMQKAPFSMRDSPKTHRVHTLKAPRTAWQGGDPIKHPRTSTTWHLAAGISCVGSSSQSQQSQRNRRGLANVHAGYISSKRRWAASFAWTWRLPFGCVEQGCVLPGAAVCCHYDDVAAGL